MNHECAAVLRVLPHVFVLLGEKLVREAPHSANDIAAFQNIVQEAQKGYPALEDVFELASEFRLGDDAEPFQIDDLIREDPPDEPYLLLGLAGANAEVFEASKLLDRSLTNHVGVLIFRIADPRWLFWCPVGYPLSDRRIVILPSYPRTRV